MSTYVQGASQNDKLAIDLLCLSFNTQLLAVDLKEPDASSKPASLRTNGVVLIAPEKQPIC